MHARRIVSLSIIVAFSLFCGAAVARHDQSEIKVMTQNQYLGADLAALLTASDPILFNQELVALLQKIAGSRFHERAQRQAALIANESPHVVALQEVWRFDCIDLLPPQENQGCQDPMIAGAFLDQLDETLAALKARGLKYKPIARVKNLDASVVAFPELPPGIPFSINGVPAILQTIDRDVILVRNDVPAKVANLQLFCGDRVSLDGCNYQVVAVAQLPLPDGTTADVPVQRGFVAIDARVAGKNYRIVNTHLEVREPQPGNPISQVFQAVQASELIGVLQATTPIGKSLLVLGDFNSSPEDAGVPDAGIIPPYQQLAAAGYTDGWTLGRPAVPGFTCCQAEDLLNKQSQLYERIDLILSWPAPARIKDIRVLGTKQWDKTGPPAPRLWPSDHAGVAAALRF